LGSLIKILRNFWKNIQIRNLVERNYIHIRFYNSIIAFMRYFAIIFTLLVVACQPIPAGEASLVSVHPDGPIYIGDQVSFEVLAPYEGETSNKLVRIALGDQVLGEQGFGQYGVGQRTQATFWWVWDTNGLEPGTYALTFSILPDGLIWTENIRLRDGDGVPPPEPDAHWATAESDCCLVYYITGTDANGTWKPCSDGG